MDTITADNGKQKEKTQVSPHCFRHTFAMRLLDKGVDIPTIAFLLGHKFLGSSLSYLHCTRDHLEEVIAKLER